jgi:hypothetical protein
MASHIIRPSHPTLSFMELPSHTHNILRNALHLAESSKRRTIGRRQCIISCFISALGSDSPSGEIWDSFGKLLPAECDATKCDATKAEGRFVGEMDINLFFCSSPLRNLYQIVSDALALLSFCPFDTKLA